MNRVRTTIGAAVIAGSLLTGGVVGGVLVAASSVSAAAASPSPSAASGTGTATSPGSPPANGSAPGKFTPNENATHEASESAAREAQENAGQVPTIP
jgi:hypothetical protein